MNSHVIRKGHSLHFYFPPVLQAKMWELEVVSQFLDKHRRAAQMYRAGPCALNGEAMMLIFLAPHNILFFIAL